MKFELTALAYQHGKLDCIQGIPHRQRFDIEAQQDAYTRGYNDTYERDQQLTNQVEEQDKCIK